MEKIRDYWKVSPPHKANGGGDMSREWSREISNHRNQVVPHWRLWINARAYTDKQVLEIGCGAGSDVIDFVSAGAHVHALDITDTAVDLTQRRLQAESLAAVSVQTYNGRTLPFADNSFNLVYSCGVLHHTPYMDDLLAEVYRVLVPGGRIKLMLYHRYSLLYYYSILYKKGIVGGELKQMSREELLSKYSEFRTGCPYTRVFSVQEIKERLWFFCVSDGDIDYPVYDSDSERKIPIAGILEDWQPCGVADIDAFRDKFNKFGHIEHLRKRYGWHLLVTAIKE